MEAYASVYYCLEAQSLPTLCMSLDNIEDAVGDLRGQPTYVLTHAFVFVCVSVGVCVCVYVCVSSLHHVLR